MCKFRRINGRASYLFTRRGRWGGGGGKEGGGRGEGGGGGVGEGKEEERRGKGPDNVVEEEKSSLCINKFLGRIQKIF